MAELYAHKTLADLGGDPVEDDDLLTALPDIADALEPLLATLTPDVDDHLKKSVAKAYFRWKRRDNRDLLSDSEKETLGALGFWLVTIWMLSYTGCLGVGPDDDDVWRRLQPKLNRVFQQPAVLCFFAKLYHFPEDHLDLESASIHRLGTTSFILKCSTRDNFGPSALKCLLYPYTKNKEIAAATEAYASTYKQQTDHMITVHRSTLHWIWMEFVDGDTLAEVLRRERGSEGASTHLKGARVSKYGVPLLDALRAVPYTHLDLAPSNIMVRTPPADDDEHRRASIVLIDFGRNYLHTQAVGSGRLSSDAARYVAPEELHSRVPAEPTGYEDIFSAGQILLELAGYGQAGGYIPKELYMEAPFLGRLFEDMLDDDPNKRMLLSNLSRGDHLDEASRRAIFGTLKDQVVAGLKAHEILSTVTPTLAAHKQERDAPAWRRLVTKLLERLGSLPMMVTTVKKPFEFRKVAKQGGPASRDFADFFKWAAACSFCWMVVWLVTVSYLANDTVNGTFRPALPDVLQEGFPPINLSLVRDHYKTLLSGWDNLPGRLVALTFGITATRYYLEIFGMQRARSPLSWRRARARVELLMRLNAVWFAPIVIVGNLWFVRHWLLFAAFALLPIIANNYMCWRLAARLAHDGAREFSTVRRSDLRDGIGAYEEWWKLMAWYAAMLACVGVLTEMRLASDVWVYAFVVVALNMIKLYRSNCGKLAPALRGNLSRAFVAGERLERLSDRSQRVGASDGSVNTAISASVGSG